MHAFFLAFSSMHLARLYSYLLLLLHLAQCCYRMQIYYLQYFSHPHVHVRLAGVALSFISSQNIFSNVNQSINQSINHQQCCNNLKSKSRCYMISHQGLDSARITIFHSASSRISTSRVHLGRWETLGSKYRVVS
ncbi:hypothetical protein BDZ45DRAFT_75870 [Acephala macrosclerotiorum]|nr:hypothetical protein BDZ45DRAFT_75870 [Acephala macrosclerotiorum]